MGCRRGFGLGNPENDPARPAERVCGLKKAYFDPGRAREWGARGVFGLGNPENDSARLSKRACGLRKADSDPRRASKLGAGGVFGLGKPENDPARPSERACGLRNAYCDPGKASERGARGVFGLGNPENDPARPSERACRRETRVLSTRRPCFVDKSRRAQMNPHQRIPIRTMSALQPEAPRPGCQSLVPAGQYLHQALQAQKSPPAQARRLP